MAVAVTRRPAIQVVNSVGTVTEGPYALSISPDNAPQSLGIVLAGIDATEEEERIGPWKNFNWAMISFPIGYRLHATLKFIAVESDPNSNYYGMTLLHRLWRIGNENQISFAALQFRMFTGATWRPVVTTNAEWRANFTTGKQGFYDVEISIASRDLVTIPGEWAQQQW